MADPKDSEMPVGASPIGGTPSKRIITEPFSSPAPDLPQGASLARPTLGQRATESVIGAAQGTARDAPVVYGGLTEIGRAHV